MELLCGLISVYLIICVVRVIFSFLPADGGGWLGAIATFAHTLTEPVFATVRRYLPTPGDLPIDFSPAVVMIVLFFLRGLLCG